MKRLLIDVAGYLLMTGFWALFGLCLIAWWTS